MREKNELSDEELVEGCIRGDRKYQELLYKKFCTKLYSLCIGYANDKDDAKDILQEACIKVFNNIRKYENNGTLEAWIRRIVVNTAIDYYRKSLKERMLVNMDEAKYIRADQDVLDKIKEKELVELIQKLPEGARLIFNLYAVEGYTHKEIAEMLDINIGTSKSQFSRAKTILQEWILKLHPANSFFNKAEPKSAGC